MTAFDYEAFKNGALAFDTRTRAYLNFKRETLHTVQASTTVGIHYEIVGAPGLIYLTTLQVARDFWVMEDTKPSSVSTSTEIVEEIDRYKPRESIQDLLDKALRAL